MEQTEAPVAEAQAPPVTETMLEQSSKSWLLKAEMLAGGIETEQDYLDALDMRVALKTLDKQIETFFEPMKKAAWESHRSICNRETEVRGPIQKADAIIKPATEAWKAAADAAAAKKQAEDDARAMEQEKARLQAISQELIAQGQPEAAAELVSQPVVTRSLATVQSAAPKVAGVSYADTYEPEVVDVLKLLKAAAAGKVPKAVFAVDMVFLRKRATDLKFELNYPGVVVHKHQNERISTSRARRGR